MVQTELSRHNLGIKYTQSLSGLVYIIILQSPESAGNQGILVYYLFEPRVLVQCVTRKELAVHLSIKKKSSCLFVNCCISTVSREIHIFYLHSRRNTPIKASNTR